MDMEQTICHCFGVSAQDIADAVNNGATSFEEVQDATQAGTGCGGCEDDARALVDELLANK